MRADDAIWDHSISSKIGDRLPESEVAAMFSQEAPPPLCLQEMRPPDPYQLRPYVQPVDAADCCRWRVDLHEPGPSTSGGLGGGWFPRFTQRSGSVDQIISPGNQFMSFSDYERFSVPTRD